MLKIRDYILYLRNECGLSVTLHPVESDTLIADSGLLDFTIHESSYCAYVKSCDGGQRRCLAQQKRVVGACRRSGGGFCGVCFAGVFEYVYPIVDGEAVVGFISVSGYQSPDGLKRLASAAETLSVPLSSLTAAYGGLRKPPSKGRIDTLLIPLCRMLELAYLRRGSASAPAAEGFGERVLHYMRLHYAIDLSADEVCRRFYCSRSYLSHRFKSETGQSFRQALNEIRIERARQLLEHSSLSVFEIAFSVGFNDSNYFSNLFRSHEGLSPMAYRRRYRQGKTLTQ